MALRRLATRPRRGRLCVNFSTHSTTICAATALWRAADREAGAKADAFDWMASALDRMGIDLRKPLFGTTDAMKNIAGKVNRVLADMDREKIGGLNAKITEEGQRGKFEFLDDADRRAYLDEITDGLFNKLTGREPGDMPHDLKLVAKRAGPLQERSFSIPDKLIEKFLEDDAELVNRRYARTVSADVELTRRFGSANMSDQLEAITNEYAKLREGVAADTSLTDAARMKLLDGLGKRERADIRDVSAVRDMLRGQYRPDIQHTGWARILDGAMAFNYMRALGGVLAASLTDAVRPAMVHGLKSYMVDGLGPVIRFSKGAKMSRQEAKLAGAIAEKWLASRVATLAELTDPCAQGSTFERFLQNASAGFSKMTGLLHWNDFQKGLTSVMTQERILRNAETAAAKGFQALPARERAYMGLLGIGQERAEALGRMFAQHGEVLEGVRVANTERWGNDPAAAGLRSAYRAAINKDVDTIIVTKGIGDTPLFMSTPTGRAVMQFKSFALASNQRVLIRGLQEDKTRMVGGIVGMTAIGAFIYMLKQIESGREISGQPRHLDCGGPRPVGHLQCRLRNQQHHREARRSRPVPRRGCDVPRPIAKTAGEPLRSAWRVRRGPWPDRRRREGHRSVARHGASRAQRRAYRGHRRRHRRSSPAHAVRRPAVLALADRRHGGAELEGGGSMNGLDRGAAEAAVARMKADVREVEARMFGPPTMQETFQRDLIALSDLQANDLGTLVRVISMARALLHVAGKSGDDLYSRWYIDRAGLLLSRAVTISMAHDATATRPDFAGVH